MQNSETTGAKMLAINTVSEEAVTATTEVKNESLLGSFGINGTLFAFQALNFLLVFLVLWFLILKPLTKKMAERQKLIDDSIANAEKIEKKLKAGEFAFQEKVDMAKVESNKIIDRAKKEAENLSEDIKTKTKKDIESLVNSARENIKQERTVMIKDIKEQTAEIVIAAVEKVLEEKINPKKDKELIEKSLAKLNYED